MTILPGLLEQLEAETGIKVNFSTFDSNEMLETQLPTGKAGHDVVVVTANFLQRQVAAGAYQPIDRARLAHCGNLDPGMMDLVAENDPGNRHGVGYMWGTTGIGCDARQVAASRPTCRPTAGGSSSTRGWRAG